MSLCSDPETASLLEVPSKDNRLDSMTRVFRRSLLSLKYNLYIQKDTAKEFQQDNNRSTEAQSNDPSGKRVRKATKYAIRKGL